MYTVVDLDGTDNNNNTLVRTKKKKKNFIDIGGVHITSKANASDLGIPTPSSSLNQPEAETLSQNNECNVQQVQLLLDW